MAAILTMFLTFLLGGIFFLSSGASVLILHYFESKPQITVFFKDTATVADASNLKKTLEDTGKVAAVKYVSKDDALAIYKEQNKNDTLLLEMVTADILPASLEVSTKQPSFLVELTPLVGKANGVEEVIYQKDVVDMLLRWTNAVRLIGGTLAGLLALDALLITVTVIGMKIALRREEVEVLKLVGASTWYIRFPFIWEGGLYGLIGASVAWAIITGMVVWMSPFFLTFLGSIPTIHTLLVDPLSATFLLSAAAFFGMLSFTGFLLGALGSMVAVNRFLKF
jgi:cell division transport system permease protein